MDTLILIDGNSLLNRAFYATPLFTTKSGLPTNAVMGFLKLLFKIIDEKSPEYLVVTFDKHAPTFRHKMYDGYKATRKGMPEELAVQMPVLKELLALMNICVCEREGLEADDLIGTLSKKFNVHSYIYTGDRDSYQLVSENTDVCFTKKGVSDLLCLSLANFYEETGFKSPDQIIDFKALSGDKSDNIPGVAGVGEKTARDLLLKYGDLDAVYANLHEQKGATLRKLTEGKESAYLSRELATIVTDADLSISLSDCALNLPFSDAVRKKFVELEFRSMLNVHLLQAESPSDAGAPAVSVNVIKTTPEQLCRVCEGADRIALFLHGDVHCSVGGTAEYVIETKADLISQGYTYDETFARLQPILNGNKPIFLYDGKEFRHFIASLGLTLTAPTEDVSILKYITDYSESATSLQTVLTERSIPTEGAACALLTLYDELKSRATDEEWRLYTQVELPLSSVLFSMEQQGVCVDIAALDALGEELNAELETLSEEIYTLAGTRFNIKSPAQLGVVLFENMGIRYPGKPKNGKYSTSVDVLEEVEDTTGIVALILKYRQLQKLVSTYVEGMRPLIDKKHTVHTTYTQTVTTTGRLSSVNPNLQNIPIRNEQGRKLRKFFVAKEGNVLIDADYSQIELRLMAHFSGSQELIEAFNRGDDIHSLTASLVFNVPMNEVTAQMRRTAKAVNFGIIYGISDYGLAKNLKIPVYEAKEHIKTYFARYPKVREYMDSCVLQAREQGYVCTLLGRKRAIRDIRASNFALRSRAEREAMNMPLQGTSADIIKIAMIRVAERLQSEGLQAKLILQVHDELVIDCPVGETERVCDILKTEMENAVSLSVPLTVEVATGSTWYDAK